MIATLNVIAVFLLQEAPTFDLRSMWGSMTLLVKVVVFILFVLSVYSFGVMIDRALMYSAARKQSRVFVQQVAGALKEGKLDEAIAIAERNKKSHIAKVVATGLSEFQSASQQVSDSDVIDAAKRGLERSVAIVHAEMKRGLSALATIGSTAPFVGLFGTVVGILNAFKASPRTRPPVCRLLPAVSPKRSSPPPSASSWPSLPSGLTTTSPTKWRPSTSRWTTPPWNSSTTSSCAAAPRSNRPWPTSHKSAPKCRPQRYSHGRHHARPADYFHGGHAHVAEDSSGGLGSHGQRSRDEGRRQGRCHRSGRHSRWQHFSRQHQGQQGRHHRQVKDRISTRIDKTVYVKSDARAKYGDVVAVVDEIRSAGVDQLGLLTEKNQKDKSAALPPPAD